MSVKITEAANVERAAQDVRDRERNIRKCWLYRVSCRRNRPPCRESQQNLNAKK